MLAPEAAVSVIAPLGHFMGLLQVYLLTLGVYLPEKSRLAPLDGDKRFQLSGVRAVGGRC